MTNEELFHPILIDFGYTFDDNSSIKSSYFLNEQDMLELCREVWNKAVLKCATTGHNFGKGVETEQAILKHTA